MRSLNSQGETGQSKNAGKSDRIKKHQNRPVVNQTQSRNTGRNLVRYPELVMRLHQLKVPDSSKLIGLTLSQSRLGDAVDIQILCILRRDGAALVPAPDDRFEAGDRLIVSGAEDMISLLLVQRLEEMFVEDTTHQPDLNMLEDDQFGLIEVMLSPHSVLSGMTLGGMNFREKYGLTVLAIWRKGSVYRDDLRDMALQFGDALLLYGPWNKLIVLMIVLPVFWPL